MISVTLTKDDVEFLIHLENDLGASENWSERVKHLWDINEKIESQNPVVQMLKLHHGATMSKFISVEECHAYRKAIMDCIAIMENENNNF